jgi:CheY-like chemotaxis protein
VTAVQLMRLRGHKEREIDVIERQVGQLARMVDDLLDVARITQGKVTLRQEHLELASAVVRGLEMAGPLLEQRRHRVEVSVPPEGLPVHADLHRLAQVVSNLLTNAAKYSELNTVIQLSAAREGDRVVLRVRDQGIGMTPELRDRVFDLFVQGPQSVERGKGGLGLGLSIVRRLVELHGGSVRALSDGPGRGSELVVSLPLAAEEPLSPPLPVPPTAEARPAERPRSRILIVDDNADAALTMREVLVELGYEVDIAYDGPTALARAASFGPDVCLLDLGLPEMDGFEVARRLRAVPGISRALRIVALTGYGQDADRRRTRDAGFNAHVVKPVDINTLTDAVAN